MKRRRMVEEQIAKRGVQDPRVLAAMTKVKRHLFVPLSVEDLAYDDHPLPIGEGQTISQPFVVAYMTEALGLTGDEKVLEIGTGSGYQAAVLSEMVAEIYTMEIIETLAQEAEQRLTDLGYTNVHVRQGDGYQGWPEEAPFDVIIVTAAPPKIPEALLEQLKMGGRMVVPVGTYSQELILITKTEQGFVQKKLIPVRFVPMVSKE